MKTNSPYWVLAYYHFLPLTDPHKEIALHKAFFEGKDVTARIYISENGINGQMSAIAEDAKKYIDWMHSREAFKNVHFKIHGHHEQAFPRLTVKYRKKLVAIDEEYDLKNAGVHVSPKEWKEMLEAKDDHVLIDVRNDYEWKVGRFEGAELPPCETFREFKEYADGLKEKVNSKETPVMMYCTGGIRCELYSAILKERGFEKVYQLNGGIINYGLEEGSDHWLGKLFVFDDRLTVPISDENAPIIGTCHHCQAPAETYINCSNIDCNTLFLGCPECVKKYKGCCSEKCQCGERLRPFHEDTAHKPFKKKHHYLKKEEVKS